LPTGSGARELALTRGAAMRRTAIVTEEFLAAGARDHPRCWRGQEKWPLERRCYCAGPIVFENAGLNFLLSEKLRREILPARRHGDCRR
jgi:hypothetical protein